MTSVQQLFVIVIFAPTFARGYPFMSPDSADHAVHKAAAGDSNELERLLAKNPALRDEAGWFSRKPLHAAAASGNSLSVEILLGLGADPNSVEHLHHDTPLINAVESDSLECIQRLLRSGADSNKPGRRGQTPVFMARSVAAIDLLVDAGANLDAKDTNGDVPFQNCVSYIGSIEVMRFWLNRGVDLNGQPVVGWPALHGIVAGAIPERMLSEDQRLEALNLLLDGGASIGRKDKSGITALDYACRSHLHLSKCVALLLQRGADPNLCDSWGNTPLVYAVTRGYHDIARLLLDHGADPNLPNHHNNYPVDFCDHVKSAEQRDSLLQLLAPVTTRADRPVPTQKDVLKRLLSIPEYQKIQRKKCTKVEIDELETRLKAKLPTSYRRFLIELGHGLGDFMISDHWRFRIAEVPELYQDEEYREFCDLPEKYFVFAERNGCWWAFFILDGNNDPAIFRFDDGEERSYRLAYRSVWEFVESLVIDYEHWHGKLT